MLAALGGCHADTVPAGASRASAPERPNILLITLDSVRADHVGAYGYERDTTPALDALANESVVFENAYAVTSWTLPSHATLFTGYYPSELNVTLGRHRLSAARETLAERLAAAGYQTAAFISGPFLRKPHNLDQGFEIYDQECSEVTDRAAHGEITNPAMERKLSEFLRAQRRPADPFFLFAYVWDPHYDYIPPSPYDQQFVPPGATPIDVRHYGETETVNAGISPAELAYVIAQYDGEIRCTDDLLGRLFAVMKALDLWNNTLIVVTADHGEEFFEHGKKGHRENLHVESLHVPLIVKPPGVAAPRRDARLATFMDVFATLLHAARLEPVADSSGVSLLAAARARPAFFELRSDNRYPPPNAGAERVRSERWFAVRDGDYKLVALVNHDLWELYDLKADPAERQPLGPAHDDKLQAMRGLLAGHRKEMRRRAAEAGKAETARLSPADVQRLRALGYVGGSDDEGEDEDVGEDDP